MPLQNTFYLDVDIKHGTFINEPTVTQNDEVTFVLRVTDDGLPYDLTSVSSFTLASVRPDKQSVLTTGAKTGTNEITFALGSTEISVPGRIEASIQLYDVDGRVSTIPFSYKVLKDLVTGYVPSENDQTLIELVLGQGPVILADAKAIADELRFVESFVLANPYKKNNMVNFEGSMYIAKVDTTNNPLPVKPEIENTWWAFASEGIVGPQGEQGIQGPQGEQGIPGQNGTGAGTVTSVNGELPNESGNVTLVIPDPDLSAYVTTQQLQTLDDEVTSKRENVKVDITDYGAKSIIDYPDFDSTFAIFAAAQKASETPGSTLFIPPGKYIIKETLDLYDYCNLTNDQYGIPTYNMFDIKGASRYKSQLIWMGGQNSDGKYGTAIILRGKMVRNGVDEIGDYLGTISDFTITTTAPRQHSGSWILNSKFTTTGSEYAGCQLQPTNHATYPNTIDKDSTINSLASCAIYFNGLNSVIERVSISGFAFGIWMGVGYGSEIRNCFLEWNNCAISFKDSITTTKATSNIIHRNAVGIYFHVCSAIEIENNVVQGNYSGADFVFYNWNSDITIRRNYSEASPKNVYMSTDSGGQFRNREIHFIENIDLKIDIDIGAIERIFLKNNHVKSSNFFGSSSNETDYRVIVEDNYKRLNDANLSYVPFTEWGILDSHLEVNDTVFNTTLENVIKDGGFSHRIVDSFKHSMTTYATKGFLEISIPNNYATGMAKITAAKSRPFMSDDGFGNSSDLTYGEYIVSWNRLPNSQVVATVTTPTQSKVSVIGTGRASGDLSPNVLASGDATSVNKITVSEKGASGDLTAFHLFNIELYVTNGNYSVRKL